MENFKIKILSQIFEVEEMHYAEKEELYFGEIEFDRNRILISKDISKERKEVTLLHEILLSVFQQLGFKKENDNEHLICSLSEALIMVIKDNPKLLTFLVWFSLR